MNECSILWCGKYHQNWETELHSHNYFQIVGISNGKAKIFVDDIEYEAEKDSVFLFTPLQMHAIHQSDQSSAPLRMIDIKFNVSDPQLYMELSALNNKIELDDTRWFHRLFNKIITESSEMQIYYYAVVSGLLFEILVRLLRQANGTKEASSIEEDIPPVKMFKGVDVDALMQYINFNYSRIISLEDLSTLANVNKTTLISIFKEIYGTTPIRYINEIRLRKAKELLINTDTSVSEIADLVGFQSIHYFSRFFKTKEGYTPMEYRMRSGQSRFFHFPQSEISLQ